MNRDPIVDIVNSGINRVISSMLNGGWADLTTPPQTRTSCIWTEDEQNFYLTVDLPGIPREAVRVSVDGSRITVRAECKGRIHRSFTVEETLPSPCRSDNITCNYQNGELTVTVPRTTPSTPPRRELPIN